MRGLRRVAVVALPVMLVACLVWIGWRSGEHAPVDEVALGSAPGGSVGDDHGSWDEDPPWDFDQTPPGG